MKRSNGIELLKFSIEKVWKTILKNAWEPWYVSFYSISWSFSLKSNNLIVNANFFYKKVCDFFVQ